MLYTSNIGCMFYYDRILYSWRICEPTMLFLLGLESITTYDGSQSDNLTLSRFVYQEYNGQLEPFVDFTIFNDIRDFLSQTEAIEDFDSYIKSDCHGLKLLMNELTGTGIDRTVPIIFKNDSNESVIDLNKPMYRLPESDRPSKSISDLRAQKIKDIFEDAGFSGDEYKNPSLYNENDKESIEEYNSIISERLANSSIYKLLDYRAMYSYSLGVLYGCRCLGFSDNVIWRIDPKFWYNGEYINLVSTAWRTFHFHYSNTIECSDDKVLKEKYTGTQINKLWNLDESVLVPPMKENENLGYLIDTSVSDKFTSTPIIYTINKKEKTIEYYNPTLAEPNKDWKTFKPKTDDNNGNIVNGIVNDSDVLVRYMSSNPIVLRKDIANDITNNLTKDNKPRYFCSVGKLGWTSNFSAGDWNSPEDNNKDNHLLTLGKRSFNNLTNSIEHAIEKSSGIEVLYYSCNVNKPEVSTKPETVNQNAQPKFPEVCRDLYGIIDSTIDEDKPVIYNSTLFKKIISCSDFEHQYTSIPTGTKKYLYDLSNKVLLYTYIEDGKTYVYGTDGKKTLDEVKNMKGLSDTEAIESFAYKYIDESKDLEEHTIRYEIASGDYWDGIQWKDNLGTEFYFKRDHIKLYKGIYIDYDSFSYSNNPMSKEGAFAFYPNINSNSKSPFIQIDGKSPGTLYNDFGITRHKCDIIEKDEFGNSLLDENGDALVWLDKEVKPNLYWNGLFNINKWVDYQPALSNTQMYNSLSKETTYVYDDFANRTISVKGTTLTYDEFYSNESYGIIREVLKVFRPETGVLPCYYDSVSDKYCIPKEDNNILPDETSVVNLWVIKPVISEQYRFVNGKTLLYNGDESECVVYDDDPTD